MAKIMVEFRPIPRRGKSHLHTALIVKHLQSSFFVIFFHLASYPIFPFSHRFYISKSLQKDKYNYFNMRATQNDIISN